MTRSNVMASSRPGKDGAGLTATSTFGSLRRLAAISAVLLVALVVVLPSSALAASEPTSGYNNTPTTTTPKSGTGPSKESSEPTKTATTPTPTTTTPTSTCTSSSGTSGSSASGCEPAKSSLPFTGFDLRWSLALGLLLIGAGFSIVVVQRRQRSNNS
jgi:hypothetical protein